MENYILHYVLDFKYGDHSSFTGVFLTLLTAPISNMQWRVEIGMFNPTHNKTRFINEKSLRVVGLSSTFRFGICFVFVVLMLFACCDTEFNLAPKKRNSCYNFSVCHWNLNSITAHVFAIIDLLQAYSIFINRT